jgi:hypothetical protein
MKCAPASEGWFGIEGYARLPLNLRKMNYMGMKMGGKYVSK